MLHPFLQPKRLRRGMRGLGGLGLGDFVSQLASAIQNYEGYYPPGTSAGGVSYPQGSLAYRNNNPGNLRPGSLAVGATGSNGGYAVFPNYQAGWNALLGLIQSSTYYGDTLSQFFQTYAPAADNNNPAAYAAGVAAQLGVDANTPISQLETGTSASAAAPAPSGDDDDSDDDDDSASPPPVLPAGTPAPAAVSSESLTDQISDAPGGISPVALGIAAALLGLALVL